METFTGIATKLMNTRIDYPSVKAEKGKLLTPGSEFEISHAIKGEFYLTSDEWYVLTNHMFVWSGYIYTPQSVPFIEKKLLITADDIGVVKEIDLGAKLALQQGWINSVAVLVNDKNDKGLLDFVQFLKTHQRKGMNGVNLYQTTHIGLHFTITSGTPVSNKKDVALLLDDQGNFTKFSKFDRLYETDQCISQIRMEFQAQYEKFKTIFKREPDHLTSHHDVLTFTRPLFNMMHEWSSSKNIPIRNHRFLPAGKRFWYDTLVIRSLDLPSISKMNRWESDFVSGVDGPAHTFVAHYGPIPPLAVVDYDKEIRKKRKKLKDGILDFLTSKDQVREIVIHLIKSDFGRQRDLINQFKFLRDQYTGIDIKYFDGRVAEYLSLKNNNPIEVHSGVEFLSCSYQPIT